ncbi:MAG: phage tail tape measure C-terminal domain-containing protein, partial [Candidatus Nanopelagicales bacterium]
MELADIDRKRLGPLAKQNAELDAAHKLLMAQMDAASQLGSGITEAFLAHVNLQENYKQTIQDLQIQAGIITGEELKQINIKKEYEAILQRLPGLTEAQKNKILELVKASQDLQKTFKETFEESLQEYMKSLENFGGQVGSAVVGAFQGMEDKLTEFVTTGKANFRDLANSIIADIARIAISQAIIKPLVG